MVLSQHQRQVVRPRRKTHKVNNAEGETGREVISDKTVSLKDKAVRVNARLPISKYDTGNRLRRDIHVYTTNQQVMKGMQICYCYVCMMFM